MYQGADDLYCYSGTTVLKNRLGLRTQAELDQFETFITAQRAAEPLPSGRLSYRHYRAIANRSRSPQHGDHCSPDERSEIRGQ